MGPRPTSHVPTGLFAAVPGRRAHMSESTQDRPDEADEKDPKPGEPDTETEGGFPKEAPESKDDEQQSKEDQ
jgi:hypothetical protein